ncbi:MAG: tail fiber protein [Gammaproteobacteria bacterium]
MATEPFLGTMTVFGGVFTIEHWAMCLGQIQAISENTALYSLLGTLYGGDARTTYGLPDMRGRSPVGHGILPGGMEYQQGLKMGVEHITLDVAHLPSHTHNATFTPIGGSGVSGKLEVATNPANTAVPSSDTYLGVNSSDSFYTPSFGGPNLVEISGLTVSGGGGGGVVTVDRTGSSVPIPILNPVLPINWLIATAGVYPPRA